MSAANRTQQLQTEDSNEDYHDERTENSARQKWRCDLRQHSWSGVFEKTEIPGAINVPLDDDDFVARVEKQAGGKDKPVVVYCASQQCNSSEKAAEQLENAGFTAITDYAGGFKAWQEEAAEVAECHSC